MNRAWTALLALPLAACALVGERGSGVAATEALELPSFDAIRLTNQVDLELTDGDAIAGEVTCDDNLLDNLRFAVRGDGTLVIDTPPGRSIRPRTDCFAVITTVGLTGLALSGSGDVEADRLPALSEVRSSGSGEIRVAGTDARSLDVRTSGSGSVDVGDAPDATTVVLDGSSSGEIVVDGIDAELVEATQSGSGTLTGSGTTDTLLVTLSGSGDLRARDLEAVDVDVDISGSGSADVHATGTLTGRLSGSGDVILFGDASVDVRRSGSGAVRR